MFLYDKWLLLSYIFMTLYFIIELMELLEIASLEE